MIKVAFIGTKNYPIPNLRGGAIETLVTAIIDENERKKQLDITVFTIDCDGIDEYITKYKNTRFEKIYAPNMLIKTEIMIWRLIRKISNYRIPYKAAHMTMVNRKLRNEHYDVIVYENEFIDMMQSRKFKNTRNVMHIHADYITPDMQGIKWAFRYCDCIVGVSDFITKKMEKIPYLAGKGITLKNAIDLSAFSVSFSQTIIHELRNTLGFSDNDTICLFCGRLSAEKGCLELIKAIRQIPNVKLLIIGGENFSSNKITKYVEQLHNEAEAIKERVVFTGHINHSELNKYLAIADIGVVPSICNEAAGLTVLEFRASRLPTIVTKAGGIPEYCDTNTSLFVELNDDYVINLSKAINIMINDKELFDQMKTNSQINLEAYGYEQYYNNFVQIMKKMYFQNKQM